jgi:hypothetical protein
MANPIINGHNLNAFLDAHSDALTEFDSTIKSELVLESATRKQLTESLGKDAAAYNGPASQLISEELQPLLDLLGDGQTKERGDSVPSNLEEILGGTAQREGAPSSDDQRTINDILTALSSQQQNAQSQAESPVQAAERQLLRSLEAEAQLRQEQARLQSQQAIPEPVAEAKITESEVAPMIEAITSPMPQVEIQLPGGGELRIAINQEGHPHILYTAPDGSVRTLAKGKTLRLQRWVNGITLTRDGTITFTP